MGAGVAANFCIRKALNWCRKKKLGLDEPYIPNSLNYCTDNAAMNWIGGIENTMKNYFLEKQSVTAKARIWFEDDFKI